MSNSNKDLCQLQFKPISQPAPAQVTPTSYQYIIVKAYFSGTPKSTIFEISTAPGASETTPNGGARSAPPFGVVSGAPGAVQSPTSTISGSRKNKFS